MTPIVAPWIDSPLEVLPRTRALLVETRHRIAVNRRQLNPWWALTGGSDAFRNGDLRLSVRDRLRRGVLVPAPIQVWAGRGTGNICAVCTNVISSDEIENEAAIRGGGVAVRLWVHSQCLSLWQSESKALEASSRI